MIVRYMITCFGTTFETLTEIESLQGPTTLYGRLVLPLWYLQTFLRSKFVTCRWTIVLSLYLHFHFDSVF